MSQPIIDEPHFWGNLPSMNGGARFFLEIERFAANLESVFPAGPGESCKWMSTRTFLGNRLNIDCSG